MRAVRYGATTATLIITFPYSRDLVAEVRQLEGRKWHPTLKHWACYNTARNQTRLRALGFTLPDNKQSSSRAPQNSSLNAVKSILKLSNELQAKLPRGLRPFQSQGVSFIESRGGRALLADEMGLGKTAQALAWLKIRDIKQAIVVCPSSIKYNWQREAKQWTGIDAHVIQGSKLYVLPSARLIIINYDILKNWAPTLLKLKPQALILDECHYIKSRLAARTKAVIAIARYIPHIIAISGTPIINRPSEFFTALNLLQPTRFKSWWHYAKEFCGLRHNGYGWRSDGATNTRELHEILTSTVMIRRLKKDVLKELPEKVRTPVLLDLDNAANYKNAEHDFIKWLKDKGEDEAAERAEMAEHFVRLEALKQLAVEGKMSAVVSWIFDFLQTGEKLVLFATHREVINKLYKTFRAVKIDGSSTPQQRQAAVDRFQNDPSCNLLIGNIKAAGVGITLTAASNVAFIELPWTPGELVQAEDRIHRIGQEASSVNVWHLLARNSIEEGVAQILDDKARVLSQVLNGSGPASSSLLTELINQMKER